MKCEVDVGKSPDELLGKVSSFLKSKTQCLLIQDVAMFGGDAQTGYSKDHEGESVLEQTQHPKRAKKTEVKNPDPWVIKEMLN